MDNKWKGKMEKIGNGETKSEKWNSKQMKIRKLVRDNRLNGPKYENVRASFEIKRDSRQHFTPSQSVHHSYTFIFAVC
jgi:hypothetical protein